VDNSTAKSVQEANHTSSYEKYPSCFKRLKKK